MESYSEIVGRFVLDLKLSDVPAAVVEKAKLVFLDTLGIALASSTMDFGAMVSNVALKLGGAEHSLVIGSTRRVAAANAVIANGTLAHGLDYDDTLEEAIVHTGCCAGMTALAVGEEVGASGAAVLEAAIAGTEVLCKVGLVAPGKFHARGFPSDGDLLDLRRRCGRGAIVWFNSGTVGRCLWPVRQPELRDHRISRRRHLDQAHASGLVSPRRRDRDMLAREGFRGPAKVFEGTHGFLRPSAVRTNTDLRNCWSSAKSGRSRG